ncbi:uncharacterized protein RJT20DRAFT_24740 [Scheffersomyces xylosifermentans]|uniref:uncharacterized protein n=1 Tax=Scheffersomyces xylosifermentans TaxID=1304137 RepID=UPI00315DBE99
MTVPAPLYKRIAVIGGGPAGLAAAKALALEPSTFETIDLYERRDKTGGLWYYGGDKSKTRPPVPSTVPYLKEHTRGNLSASDKYFSPMYKHLETNLISSMMEYRDVHFPQGTAVFPSRSEVLRYVLQYEKTIPDTVNIHMNANVVSIEKSDEWTVTIENTENGSVIEKRYDAIVIANGHFEAPYIPDVPGLEDWNKKSDGSVTHAKYFDVADAYKDKNVVVVGHFASGVDISTQLSVCARNVYVSVRNVEEITPSPDSQIKYIGLITNYDFDNDRTITTAENEHIKDVDYIIYCTGYLYSIPFLKTYSDIITDGNQLHDIYNQIFYIKDPSLTFVALCRNVIPMPLAESQGAIIAKVYSGKLKLPTKEEMQLEYKKELEIRGTGKDFHSIPYPKDVEYYRELQNILDRNGLNKEGLSPPIWDEKRANDRRDTKKLKSARQEAIVEHASKLRESGESFRLLDSL